MGRLRGCLWLTAGVVVAVLAGLVAYITLTRASAERASGGPAVPQVSVVVAARALSSRTLLTAEDLQIRSMPVDSVPEGAVQGLEGAVGRLSLVDLYPGEVLLAQRLVDPNVISGDGRSAVVVADDQVLVAFPVGDLLSRSGVLKAGDQVDLLFSFDFPIQGSTQVLSSGEAGSSTVTTSARKELAAFTVLQNVTIAAIVPAQTTTGSTTQVPDAILLTVTPQDALVLKFLKDSGGTLDIVLRAPGADRLYDTSPVDMGYVINRFRIPIESTR